MRPGHLEGRGRGYRRALVLVLGAAALAGCSSLGIGGGGDDPGASTSPSFSSRFSSFFSSAKPGVTQPKSPSASTPEVDCPGVDIRGGASTMLISGKSGPDATAGDLRYQLSIGQTARECRVENGNMFLKVGIQGRLIVGPLGAPGQVDAPIRYAVVREGPEPRPIATRFKRVPVIVPPEQSNIQFIDVEEGLSFPLPSNAELDAYVVYVGFDELGDRTAKQPAKKSPPKRPPRQQ
jgi:hypothetical protein